MGHYRDPTHVRSKTPGQESYPTMSTSSSSSRTLPRPRPKSLIMGTSDIAKIKKYKSVVTLKQSDSSANATMTPPQYYQRSYVPNRTYSPTKSTSPTHEALTRSAAKRKLSYSENIVEPPARMITSSEYFSMSHSSEYESDAWQLKIHTYNTFSQKRNDDYFNVWFFFAFLTENRLFKRA